MGAAILSEAPFITKTMPIEPTTAESFKKFVPEIAYRSPSAAYYDLWTHHGTETRKSLYDRFNTNCFQISADITTAEKGLFYVASRINHSHRPNAKWKYDPESGRLLVIALDDIRTGDEVLISYCCTSRDTRMLGYYSFKCQCSFCVNIVHPGQDILGPEWKGFPHQDCGRCTACRRPITKRLAIKSGKETEVKELEVAVERVKTRSAIKEKQLLQKECDDEEDLDDGEEYEEYYEEEDDDDWEDYEEEDDSVGSAAEFHYFH
ncbi:hypothetical protein F5884DRAFT_783029 [Xylogone sp. PMI_703]|nr:hypothetical protein F5884DRAFT_783029 [Xylogone sp. PMI_703]